MRGKRNLNEASATRQSLTQMPLFSILSESIQNVRQ